MVRTKFERAEEELDELDLDSGLRPLLHAADEGVGISLTGELLRPSVKQTPTLEIDSNANLLALPSRTLAFSSELI